MTPVQHAQNVISAVRLKTDRALLFYSCGKDSIALLDLMAGAFKEVHCVFMYFIKGMEHQECYLRDIQRRYPNVVVHRIPHWNLSYIIRCGTYCTPREGIKLVTLEGIDRAMRAKTGIDWSFAGFKQSDGMNRRLMLRGYEMQAINEGTGKAYPLTLMKDTDVMRYIKHHRLPDPIRYSTKTRSSGSGFNADFMLYIRQHYPDDLTRFLRAFPLSERILAEADYRAALARELEEAKKKAAEAAK